MALSDELLRFLNVADDITAIRTALEGLDRKLDAMSEREDAAYAQLNSTIQTVKDGWASLVAERDQYKAALEQADAEKAQAVADVLAADSDVDAAKVEAADAALAELNAQPAQPAEPPAEPPA